MTRMHRLSALCLCSVLAAGAQAQGYVVQGLVEQPAAAPLEAPPLSPGIGSIGPDQAAAIARAQTGGRVLDVQRVVNGPEGAFAVRLLLDAGRVRTVVVDGQSGQLR